MNINMTTGRLFIAEHLPTLTELYHYVAAFVRDRHEVALELIKLRKESQIDALTELGNYKSLCEHLAIAEAHAERGHPQFVLMADLTGFGKINKHHGHAAGNEALKLIATRIKQTVRKTDRVFRYGGDEFVVIFAAKNIETAQKCAERWQKTVDDNITAAGYDTGLRIGLAQITTSGHKALRLADPKGK